MTYGSVHQIQISALDESTDDLLGPLLGHVCLHVNIATKTGYLPKTKPLWSWARTAKHLYELQQLHDMFRGKNFAVIGYPCNQFGEMEQGTDREILENLKTNYPFVTFPITTKVDVNGPAKHAVWKYLGGDEIRAVDDTAADTSKTAATGQNIAGGSIMRIPNNYEKFLTNRAGRNYWRFNWGDSPIGPAVAVGSPSVVEVISEIL